MSTTSKIRFHLAVVLAVAILSFAVLEAKASPPQDYRLYTVIERRDSTIYQVDVGNGKKITKIIVE